MAFYPALDVTAGDEGLVLAVVDDFAPVAVEEQDGALTIFFSDSQARNGALEAVARAFPALSLSTRDVDDGDWARRSQQNLQPVTIGRITVAPPWAASPVAHDFSPAARQDFRPATVVIQPSMGFGTAHHATTRLCLAALQTLDLTDRDVLDVGTGSGVLAIAARRLGARRATGIDVDPDAIQSARENIELNPGVDRVTLDVVDVSSFAYGASTGADVVVANLTGAVLVRSAALLLRCTASTGTIIVSGLLEAERTEVLAAFAPAQLTWEAAEDGWIALRFNHRRVPAV